MLLLYIRNPAVKNLLNTSMNSQLSNIILFLPFNSDSAQGGTIWSRGQTGPMINYAKTIKTEKPNTDKEMISNRVSFKFLLK